MLAQPYRYPASAYATVSVSERLRLTPELPATPCTANVIRIALPGINLLHERVALVPAGGWGALGAAHSLCFVTMVERRGRFGGVAHGLLRDLDLPAGRWVPASATIAVTSSSPYER